LFITIGIEKSCTRPFNIQLQWIVAQYNIKVQSFAIADQLWATGLD